MKEKSSGVIPSPLPWMREVQAISRPRSYAERQTRRYRRRLQLLALNGLPAEDTFILDLSANGLKLETSRPLAVNDLVEVTFRLSPQGEERCLAGRVVWVKPAPPVGQRYFLGLRLFKAQWDVDLLAREWEKIGLID